jgi:4-hydroxybenzoate polyprenyltransferase
MVYLLSVVVSIAGVRGLARRWSPQTHRQVLLPVAFAMTIGFLLVDTLGLARGWFATPAGATALSLAGAGPLGRGFPIEEPLLLLGITSLLVIVADAVSTKIPASVGRLGLVTGVADATIGALCSGAAAALFSGTEYSVAAAMIAGAGLSLAAPLLRRDRGTRVAASAFILLTLIFDNALCAWGVLIYPGHVRSGVVIGYMPIEDLLYAIGLAGMTLRLRIEVIQGRGSAWRIFLAARPISWVNTALPFVGGVLAAGAGESLGGWLLAPILWWGAGYNLYLYGINDLYDRASDAANPRKGGAEGALLRTRDLAPLRVALVAGGLLPAIIMAIVLPAPANTLPLVGIVFATLYSAPWFVRARAIPIVDSLVSSVHFLVPPIAGLLLGNELHTEWFAPLSALALWGLASHGLGALQDIAADGRSGIRTVATYLGARRTAQAIVCTYLLAALPLATQPLVLMKAAAIIPILSCCSALPLLRDASSWGSARAAWRRFLWLNAPLGAYATILMLQSWK